MNIVYKYIRFYTNKDNTNIYLDLFEQYYDYSFKLHNDKGTYIYSSQLCKLLEEYMSKKVNIYSESSNIIKVVFYPNRGICCHGRYSTERILEDIENIVIPFNKLDHTIGVYFKKDILYFNKEISQAITFFKIKYIDVYTSNNSVNIVFLNKKSNTCFKLEKDNNKYYVKDTHILSSYISELLDIIVYKNEYRLEERDPLCFYNNSNYNEIPKFNKGNRYVICPFDSPKEILSYI